MDSNFWENELMSLRYTDELGYSSVYALQSVGG